MDNTLKEISKLKKKLTNPKDVSVLMNIRKSYLISKRYAQKGAEYLSLTLDGVKPEIAAKELKLI